MWIEPSKYGFEHQRCGFYSKKWDVTDEIWVLTIKHVDLARENWESNGCHEIRWFFLTHRGPTVIIQV